MLFVIATLTWILAFPTTVEVLASGPTTFIRSPDLVKQLTILMKERGLTSLAAPDAQVPGQYVAAMLFPGVQLLVISARTDAVAYIEAELAAQRHANVYSALQHGVQDSKVFVQDMGADGLHGATDRTPDTVYLRGVDQHILDGDYEAAKMTRAAYEKHVESLDGRYAALLTLLIDRARGASPVSQRIRGEV